RAPVRGSRYVARLAWPCAYRPVHALPRRAGARRRRRRVRQAVGDEAAAAGRPACHHGWARHRHGAVPRIHRGARRAPARGRRRRAHDAVLWLAPPRHGVPVRRGTRGLPCRRPADQPAPGLLARPARQGVHPALHAPGRRAAGRPHAGCRRCLLPVRPHVARRRRQGRHGGRLHRRRRRAPGRRQQGDRRPQGARALHPGSVL
ncbi:hypothetical protein LPJ73_002307, partial [Coemansia sp. RSA 2703]